MKVNRLAVLVIILILAVLAVLFVKFLDKRGDSDNLLSLEEIKSEILRLEEINKQPGNELINMSDYPKILGIDKRNGKVLKEIYDCRDLCPASAGVVVIYDNISSKDECNNIDGVVVDNLWPFDGRFEWCKPNLESEELDEEECLNVGGKWEEEYMVTPQTFFCNLPTSDSGKICKNSNECESYCQAPKGSREGMNVLGNCYGWMRSACMREVQEGVALGEKCV